MNNNFAQLAEQFLLCAQDELSEDEYDLDSEILKFLANRGIDHAWLDEAAAVIREYFDENH